MYLPSSIVSSFFVASLTASQKNNLRSLVIVVPFFTVLPLICLIVPVFKTRFPPAGSAMALRSNASTSSFTLQLLHQILGLSGSRAATNPLLGGGHPRVVRTVNLHPIDRVFTNHILLRRTGDCLCGMPGCHADQEKHDTANNHEDPHTPPTMLICLPVKLLLLKAFLLHVYTAHRKKTTSPTCGEQERKQKYC